MEHKVVEMEIKREVAKRRKQLRHGARNTGRAVCNDNANCSPNDVKLFKGSPSGGEGGAGGKGRGHWMRSDMAYKSE